MEKIELYQQFGEKVREFKKQKEGVLTNCYFLPNEVRKMTEKGSLYLETYEDCLQFFVREEHCNRLYYYLSSGTAPKIQKQELPVFLDFVFREGPKAQEQEVIELWEKAGFQPYKKYRRMECLKKDFLLPSDQNEMLRKYPLKPLVPADYENCISLWKAGLDEFSTLLPDREEFADACAKEQIMGVRASDGSVGAVIRGIFKGKTAFMQHLVADPNLRGIGLGRTVFGASIDAMFTKYGAEKVNFWVDEKNVHAIAIYKRMGFVNDGMISGQLKLDAINMNK